MPDLTASRFPSTLPLPEFFVLASARRVRQWKLALEETAMTVIDAQGHIWGVARIVRPLPCSLRNPLSSPPSIKPALWVAALLNGSAGRCRQYNILPR